MRLRLLGVVVLGALAVAAIVLALGGTVDHTSAHDGTQVAARLSLPGAGGSSSSRTSAATRIGVSRTRGGAGTTAPGVTTPATPTLTPSSQQPTGAGERMLNRALGRDLAGTGPDVGALVYDMSSHRMLYARNATVGRPPASVEKLWTTTAMLERLGPQARLHTTVLGTGSQRGHVWHGDLYLHGAGDPTFGETGFNEVWNHGEGADVSTLVAALRRRGIRRVTGRLYPDASLFDSRRGGLITGQRPDIPDLGGQLSALTYDHGTTPPHDTPTSFAAHEVALTMREGGITVKAATRPRRTPDAATPLASVASPTMEQMLRLMNVPSDDFFAELFAKQLGVLYGHGGTIASGAAVIGATIASDFGLHPRILDGSGLGRADRTSPLQIVELLRDIQQGPIGPELLATLPRTGVNGTVQGIGAKTPAQGRCLAKTGSLNDVTNLAGLCTTRSGQRIAFGILLDGPDNATGFALESRMVGAIARY